jgi:hypothetical protein
MSKNDIFTKVGGCMKIAYTKLFSFILGFTFILSSIIFVFTSQYKDEKQEIIDAETKIVDEIFDIYELFKNKTEIFGETRDNLIEKISEYTAYYTNMAGSEYETIIEELTQYEKLVAELEDNAVYLKEHCISTTYSSSDANSKCNSYIINYEKTVNAFIGDITFFNSKIDEYNTWAKEENNELNEEKYQNLNKFESEKYNQYIDINGDGTYLGQASD